MTCPFDSFTYPPTHSKDIYNQLFINYIHLIFMPKINIYAFEQRCVQKFQHYITYRCLPIHQKQRNKPCFRSSIFFLSNILLVFHLLNMFIMIMFCMCPHESVRIWNFNTFLHKCSSIQDCAFCFHYNFQFMPFHLRHPSMCF